MPETVGHDLGSPHPPRTAGPSGGFTGHGRLEGDDGDAPISPLAVVAGSVSRASMKCVAIHVHSAGGHCSAPVVRKGPDDCFIFPGTFDISGAQAHAFRVENRRPLLAAGWQLCRSFPDETRRFRIVHIEVRLVYCKGLNFACRYQFLELLPLPHAGRPSALIGAMSNGPQIFRIFECQKNYPVGVCRNAHNLPREVCKGIAEVALLTFYCCQDF